jgi:hypothetical protein
MWIAAAAFAAMIVQDVLSVLLTQAETRQRAKLAGLLDALGWLVGIYTINWSLNAIGSHDLVLRYVVIGAVTAANFIGSYLGTKIGDRINKPSTPASTAELEARVLKLESLLITP